MPGIAIKPGVLAELQRQLNHELSAAHAYTALAVWCDDRHFPGFARFFNKQSAEEREHGSKMMAHLLDRGALPQIGAIDAPRGQFSDLMDLARHAQKMEQDNTVGINTVYEAAVREKDYPVQVLMQWFINEQVEEEAWADELIDRVQRANCAGGIAELDRHIERYLGGGKEEK